MFYDCVLSKSHATRVNEEESHGLDAIDCAGRIGAADIGMYNSLVRLKVQSENAWADIDVQLKRRYDLLPNLVETVKGYDTRSKRSSRDHCPQRAMAATTPSARRRPRPARPIAEITFALAEAYPQLRAVESFTQLQGSLNQIEEAVQNARRYYNAVVRDLNTKIQEFPSNLIAGFFSFKQGEFFELVDVTERAVPKVSFDQASR
jgi:LemA protein